MRASQNLTVDDKLTTAHARRTRFIVVSLALFFLMLIAAVGCKQAPISGRRQLLITPESQEISMGVEAFEQMMEEETASTNQPLIELVNRVGQRIAAVANRPDYDWEFRLVASPVQNAFALPGGKVAIYEGILPICQSEAGLAVVMSHEIAHALARHGGERMSQQSIVGGLGNVVQAVSKDRSERQQQIVNTAYGVGSKYGVTLPFSRKQESEADSIGLILMSKAGYDPSEAPHFWERFSQAGGDKPLEFMSTHPSDARRASDLREMLPEALTYYNKAQSQYGLGVAIMEQPSSPARTMPAAHQQPIGQSASLIQPLSAEVIVDDPPFTNATVDESPTTEPASGTPIESVDPWLPTEKKTSATTKANKVIPADFALPVRAAE